MGDRINVVLYYDEEETKQVTFYSHWGGYGMLQCVADALNRGRRRWSDESYLARIIFSEMIKDEIMELTGYGIYPDEYHDAGRETIYVNLYKQTVRQGSLAWNYDDFITSIKSTIQ